MEPQIHLAARLWHGVHVSLSRQHYGSAKYTTHLPLPLDEHSIRSFTIAIGDKKSKITILDACPPTTFHAQKRSAMALSGRIMEDLSRTERKRHRTRKALIDATRKLAYRGGQEKISVQDITEEADVGLGTFYNYFEHKQAIFEAVLDDIQEMYDMQLEKFSANIKDPAMLMAATLKYTFQHALNNEDWLIFLAYSGRSRNEILHQSLSQCRSFLQQGMSAGRFKIGDIQFTLDLISGMVRHVILGISEGNLEPDASKEAIRCILRMLGIPDVVARALSESPLPAVAVPRRTPLPEVVNWKIK
jgi:AcrR family transcriptional regulator